MGSRIARAAGAFLICYVALFVGLVCIAPDQAFADRVLYTETREATDSNVCESVELKKADGGDYAVTVKVNWAKRLAGGGDDASNYSVLYTCVIDSEGNVLQENTQPCYLGVATVSLEGIQASEGDELRILTIIKKSPSDEGKKSNYYYLTVPEDRIELEEGTPAEEKGWKWSKVGSTWTLALNGIDYDGTMVIACNSDYKIAVTGTNNVRAIQNDDSSRATIAGSGSLKVEQASFWKLTVGKGSTVVADKYISAVSLDVQGKLSALGHFGSDDVTLMSVQAGDIKIGSTGEMSLDGFCAFTLVRAAYKGYAAKGCLTIENGGRLVSKASHFMLVACAGETNIPTKLSDILKVPSSYLPYELKMKSVSIDSEGEKVCYAAVCPSKGTFVFNNEEGVLISGDCGPLSLAPGQSKKVKVAATKISKLKAGKKSVSVTWSKKKGVTGYQIRYSTSKKFAKSKTKTVKVSGYKSYKKTVKKLKKSKKYYVKVRCYKTVGTITSYSSWSKAKSVTTK